VLSGVRGDLLDELNSIGPEYAERGKDGCVRRAEGVACCAFYFRNVWNRALATFGVHAAHFQTCAIPETSSPSTTGLACAS
jgi:hypothetical protein